MQHVDYDMDDLYKRAAENYHLEKPDWDWNSVKSRLTDDPADNVIVAPVMKKRIRTGVIAILLFLLLSTSFIFYTLQSDITVAHFNEAVTGAIPLTNDKYFENNSSSVVTGTSNRLPDTFIEQAKMHNGTNEIGVDGSPHTQSIIKATGDNHDVGKGNKVSIHAQDDSEIGDISMNEGTLTNTYIGPSGKNILIEKLTTKKKSMDQLAGLIPQNVVSEQIGRKKKNKSGFYIGLAAGVDFSKVKSRPYRPGFNGGILGGYSINSKLSVEIGLFEVTKHYSSEGKYFNMDKMNGSMPSGMIINNLESKSKMVEIPFKAKYNIIHKTNIDLFVSAGTSFYIMTSEHNKYNVTYNGGQEKMTADYKKNSYKFPATANISMGYQHTVSKQIDLRIEPFLRIPLQGIGIGSLPVASTGIHAGIIRRLK
ncbi:MAG: outer membrane beta-barrel protein [Ferruginibacter sp.]